MDKNMQRFKNDAGKIPVPDKLDLVIESAIRRAKKKNGLKWFKPAGAAACIAAFILSVNVFPSFASYLENNVPQMSKVLEKLVIEYEKEEEKLMQEPLPTTEAGIYERIARGERLKEKGMEIANLQEQINKIVPPKPEDPVKRLQRDIFYDKQVLNDYKMAGLSKKELDRIALKLKLIDQIEKDLEGNKKPIKELQKDKLEADVFFLKGVWEDRRVRLTAQELDRMSKKLNLLDQLEKDLKENRKPIEELLKDFDAIVSG